MYLQESGEMYLETIYILSQHSSAVRSIDVAEHMGYSKPSISRAVGLLKQGGYLTVEKDGSLVLTEHGRAVAEYRKIQKAMENHKVIDDPTVEQILETEQAVYEMIESRW